MTETDWLKAKDPDAMLRLVSERLSARRWHLLAAAVVRRAWDLLPPGLPREVVDHQELGEFQTTVMHLGAELEAASDRASTAARAAERLVVLAADPDADPESFHHMDARKTNPSAPLFQAACRYAQDAIRLAGEATGRAVETAAALALIRPGPALVEYVREGTTAALRIRTEAGTYTAAALKLKAMGDDMADRANGRKVGQNYATATEITRREEEYLGYRAADLTAKKEKLDRKALGRILHDLVGNPFRAVRFEPEWRTEAVLGLARGIDEDRAFDRLPILADALLEADCDEEAVLRHCRGTEAHERDPHHGRGCWVIDLILDREPEFFARLPLQSMPAIREPRANARSANRLEVAEPNVGR